jgi:tetratricopeptide (TPR) repeat protein
LIDTPTGARQNRLTVTTERVQRQIDRLLDEAEAALSVNDWDTVSARAQAVLRLDPDNADAKAYLAAATREPAAAPPPAVVAQPATEPSQPASFANGRYEVRRFLGEGGKKKVFLAHDAQLDRDVAFALIKTEGLDEAARTRVTREAQAMGRLGSHPHIVTVYDIGEEAGAPYLVLPVLPLGDVEGVIEKAEGHKLPIEQAVRIATETCLGLEFSHAKGIIHRDLKPGNVWLAEDGRAMIGDFGLAVAVDRSRLTQAGMMVGTVNYMPPEQAMGGEVTPRSDLYALGAMLYEMVCGRPPFVGDESVAIIGQHLNTPPVAPSWHRPDCPPGLEALILRLLEKDPSKRPASATEVREALQAVEQSGRTGAGASPAPTEVAPAAPDPLYRRTFVGRENETRQLHQAYDAAVSGQGGLVMVVGEPGIGKTALCEQLATYVQLRGGRTLVGHCYEEGSLSLPYLAFVEAMRSYVLARDPEGLRTDLGSGAADVARIVSEVRDRVQGVELREASDPEDDRWRLLNAVSSFLRNASAVQPLVIVLEDLHWADRGTLDLLLHLARNLDGARLLIVGTYRDVEVDRTHPLSATLADLRRINTFLRVPLRGLTVDEVHRMYEAIRGNEVPWGQAEAVHRQTEGNPLFVQEVLRYLVEEGIVVRQDGRYVGAGLGVGIPDGLRDVVGRRLGHMSPQTNEVLAIASVIGREFSLPLLARVAGLTEDAIVSALEEASSRSVIEEHRGPGPMTFRFTHAFFRQVLYEEIFAPRRIRLHQQVGRALEEMYSRRLDEHAAELAEHFAQSTETPDLRKAVLYGEQAAQRAQRVFDYGGTARYLEQALKAQEVMDPEDRLKRCDLLLTLVRPLSMAGEKVRASQEVAEEAFQLAEALGDRDRALEAFRLADESISRHWSGTFFPERLVWTNRGDRLAPDGSIFRVYADAAAYVSRVGSREERLERLSRAFELARKLNDSDALFRVGLFILLEAWTTTSRVPDSRALAEEALSWPRQGVLSIRLGEILRHAAFIYCQLGETERARQLSQELAELGARYHDVSLSLFAQDLNPVYAMMAGDFAGAIEQASQVMRAWQEAGRYGAGATPGRLAMRSFLALGRADEYPTFSADDPEEDDLVRRATGSARLRATIVRAATGDEDGARMTLSAYQASPLMAESEDASGVLAMLVEAAVLLRDPNVGVDAANQLIAMSGCFPIVSPVSVDRLLGDFASLNKDASSARGWYEKAVVACEKAGHRPELAETRAHLAELLLDHYPDERDAAIEHLDFAIAGLRDMKMQPALERALRRRGLLKA